MRLFTSPAKLLPALALPFLVVLSGCGLLGQSPATLTTIAPQQHRADFASPEDEPSAFLITIVGSELSAVTTMAGEPYPGCGPEEVPDNATTEWACNLGILSPGQSMTPLVVHGRGVSCDVVRYPVLKLYPCRVVGG